MYPITERDILCTAQTLAGMQPPPETVDAAMRRAWEATEAKPAWFRLLIRQSWMRGAVAALIALFAGTSFFLFSRPVSAADALRTVIQANDAYKGWVHATLQRVGNGSKSSGRSVHFNTADHTMAIIDGQGRHIQLFSPATAAWSSYDGQQILIGDLGDRRAIQEQADELLLTWPEVREKLACAMEDTATLVKQSRDEALDRFDVIITPKNQGAGNPTQVTLSVWADPETKLIQMMSASSAEPGGQGIFIVTYRYGEPAVADIYAAGAPKDAPVVDKRTASDTATLVKRIREAMLGDVGDYLAVLTRSKMKNGGIRKDGGMKLELLAKRGQYAAKHVYSVGTRNPHTPAWMHVIPTPDGWPEPEAEDVLRTLGQYNPSQGTLFDGMTITSYAPDSETGSFHTQQQRGTDLDHAWVYMLPAHAFGSSLSQYTRGGPGTTFESLPTDKSRSGLQGLRVSIEQPTRETPSHIQADIWCDPTKGFVPVEFLVQLVREGSPPLRVERHVFTEFTTLGNGRFCPRVWQETIAQSGETYECHLAVLPNQTPDETWLSLPKYLPDQPPQR